jgi:hypothetical protein
VNVLSLTDDTDFKTIETAVAYNAAGMDLNWHFTTTAGVTTVTAVTPTTAGTYDWVHQGQGMYSIEIPASGGVSINNFTGFVTGVLPFRGPTIGFRAAALNNADINGGDVRDVNIVEIGGATQSATDLKDFADAGYDPATNKVQGVVLVDTTTVNTDMRGTDSAATAANLAIVDTVVDGIQTTLGTPTDTDIATDIVNLNSSVGDIPTVSEFNARSLASADYTVVSDLGTVQTGDSFAYLGTNLGLIGANATEAGGTGDHLTAIVADVTKVNGDATSAAITKVNGDATSAANLEAMYNGTGYLDDTAPSSRSQLLNLSVGSGGISTVATGVTIDTGGGTETLTYTATVQEDGSYHEVAVATDIDFYYEFNVGATGVPIECKWVGYVNSNNDNVEVYAYNYAGTAYEQISVIAGTTGATVQRLDFILTTSHVGTGADLGLVRLRFESAGADIATVVATDRVLCEYTVVSSSLGFVNGSVWVDTNLGTAGTGEGVGTITVPSSNIDDAMTIAAANNLSDLHIAPNSAVTPTGAVENYEIFGHEYTIDLNGQSFAGTYIQGASILASTATGAGIQFEATIFDANVTLPPCVMRFCYWGNMTITAGSGGDYYFNDCRSRVSGSNSPTFNFSTGFNVGLSVRSYSGGITLEAMASGDTLSLEGTGALTEGTCSGGSVSLRGAFKQNGITNITVTADDTTTDVVSILADTNELQSDDIPTTLATLATAANLATAQADLDIITGASGVNLLTATQASIDAIEVDTSTTIPATITTAQADLDIITGASGVNLLTATQASIDAIEVDTSTTIPATLATLATATDLATVDTVVDGIQSDLSNATDGLGALKVLIDALQVALDAQNDIAAADVWAVATRTLTANTNLNDPTAVAIATAVWDRVVSKANHNIAQSAGRYLRTLAQAVGAAVEGVVNADGSETTTSFKSDVSGVDSFYDDQLFVFTTGALAGSAHIVSTYTQTDGVFTFDEAWLAVPANGDEFAITPIHIHTLTDIKEAVRAEMDANSTKLINIEADTNELQTDDVPGLIAALNNISTAQVNTEVDTALADYDAPTKAELDSAIATLNNLSATDINAQMLDVLNTDTLIDGKTIVQALQIGTAILGGKVSGAGTGTEVFVGADGSTVRVTVTVDANGNRTAVVYS